MAKYVFTRKINLQKYSGNQYESADFQIEVDETEIPKNIEPQLFVQKQIENWIIDYIKNLPQEMAEFEKAKSEQPPFIEKPKTKWEFTGGLGKEIKE